MSNLTPTPAYTCAITAPVEFSPRDKPHMAKWEAPITRNVRFLKSKIFALDLRDVPEALRPGAIRALLRQDLLA